MSGAPSAAIGSQRNPATSVPSASTDPPDAQRRRDLVDERAEAGGVELPHLDLDGAGARRRRRRATRPGLGGSVASATSR